MKRNNPRIQHLIPAGQQYRRNLTDCNELPPALQQWMCPACSVVHTKVPASLTNYRCSCGWFGDRHQLLRAEHAAELPQIVVTSRKGNEPFLGEYVGRPSPLGNPFMIGRDGTREQVIAKYRSWIVQEWDREPHGVVMNEIRRLARLAMVQPLRLICWCAPEACHADVIKQTIELIIQYEPKEPT